MIARGFRALVSPPYDRHERICEHVAILPAVSARRLRVPMPSLLLTAAPTTPILPVDHLVRRTRPLWTRANDVGTAGAKELAVGDDQDARYAAQQAKIEQAYAILPTPGTPAYWQALDGAEGEALPLEALVRCYREREAAGARDDAERIYTLVMGRSQQPTQVWARKIARYEPAQTRHDLEEDLEQACYFELWRVMADAGQSFILVNFNHMLHCIQEHVAHKVMEQEGHWTRRGVGTPRRVPRQLTDSADQSARDADEQDAAAIPIPDPNAEEAFEQVERAADMDALLAALSPEQLALLRDLIWRGLSQDEVADKLGVTDRTVRNRLKSILVYLRGLLAGEEGYPHGG